MHRVDALLQQLHANTLQHQPARPQAVYPHSTNSHAVAPGEPPSATAADITSPPDTTDSQLALDAERATATFATADLTHFLDGSAGTSELKAMVAVTIAADPVLNPPNVHALSRHQQRTASMLKIKQCAEMVREQLASQPQPSTAIAPFASTTGSDKREGGGGDRAGVGKAFEDAFYGLMSLLDPSWSIRMGVHYGLFASSINSQGSDEQRQRYQRRIAEMRVIGCFAMTEMGHGSNVSAIETTATYDARRGCFVLHSPTLTSTKWWIGGAAHMATHAAVYAQLIHNSTKRGVYCFVVQIRDSTSGRVVPGMTIGDMGEKMGRQGLDNGFIRFDRMVVARECMMSRWAEVDAAGEWVEKAGAGGRTTYAALIATRVELFGQCSDVLKLAVTIAVRYGCVRRQGWRGGQRGVGDEVRLMDYETHQRRLLPIVAHAVAIQLTAKRVQSTVDAMLISLTSATSSSQSTASSSVLSALESVHATTAGMKSFATSYVNDAIEVCRQSLGGQGYSVYALLPGVRADWAVMCTWEGDNTVLALQCAKHMLRRWDGRSQASGKTTGDTSADPFAYLTAEVNRPTATVTMDTLHQPTAVVDLFRQRVQHMLCRLTASNDSSAVLLSKRATECIQLAKAHCDYYMLDCFASTLSASTTSPSVHPILSALFTTHSTSLLLDSLSDFLLASLLPATPSPVPLLSAVLTGGLAVLRPNAVALVDAFALPDMVLGPLGRYDGRVYEALFECVQASGGGERGGEASGGVGAGNGVVDYWVDLIRPLTGSDQ